MSETSREQVRIAAGRCARCGGEPLPGKRKCQACYDKLAAYMRTFTAKKKAAGVCPECCRPSETGKKLCADCRQKRNGKRLEEKRECFEHYGGARCAECGETILEFLTLDHISGGGKKHRRSGEIPGSGAGKELYGWLRKQKYPPLPFQVLCFNCNAGRYLEALRARPLTGNNKPGRCSRCGPHHLRSGGVCAKCQEHSQRLIEERKLAAMDICGGRYCACCGVTKLEWLTFDHITPVSAERRRAVGDYSTHGMPLYRRIVRLNDPCGCRILCFKCNAARTLFGICPHQR